MTGKASLVMPCRYPALSLALALRSERGQGLCLHQRRVYSLLKRGTRGVLGLLTYERLVLQSEHLLLVAVVHCSLDRQDGKMHRIRDGAVAGAVLMGAAVIHGRAGTRTQ